MGLAAGSAWIDSLFAELGVKLRILAVYHARAYLDKVMLAWGWDEAKRLAQRCRGLRGDINAKLWLNHPKTLKFGVGLSKLKRRLPILINA